MPPISIEFIARALIVLRGHCLICWNPRGRYGYLPGGHIESEESAATALVREMAEETGLRARAGTLLLVHENRFRTATRAHHEINLVFAAAIIDRAFLKRDNEMCHVAHSTKALIPARQKGSGARKVTSDTPVPPPPIDSAEAHLAFRWLALAELRNADIRPAPMARWTCRMIAGGLDSTIGLTVTSAPTAEWLSTMHLR